MAIEFSCESCGKHYSQPEANAGKKARCKCGAVFTVPQAGSTEPEPTDLYGFSDEPVQQLPASAQQVFERPTVYQAGVQNAPSTPRPPVMSTPRPARIQTHSDSGGGGGLKAALGGGITVFLVLLGLAGKGLRAYNRSQRNSNQNIERRAEQPTGAQLRRMQPAGN